MPGRLVLLLASPRVAPGLLSRSAWQALESAATVLGRDEDEPLVEAVDGAGMPVGLLPDESPPQLARTLLDATADADGEVVWLGSADGDPGLTDAVAAEVTRLGEPPEVEVLVGSWDVPGARLLDAVAVMDRLRSPGGCPWDAEQTHASLVTYLLEEAYEAAEAIDSGDRRHMTEELGDVLLQVLFQARVAQEHRDDAFDIDDVAGALVEKLVRRHPHVFADGEATSPADVETAWEQIKAEEKASRAAGAAVDEGLAAGIPASLPSLARAEKVLGRWERRGGDPATLAGGISSDLGDALLVLVARARAEGVSADAALLAALRRLEQR